jgi:hypothetical protein
LLDTTEDTKLNYEIKGKGNGVYIFMISGEAEIDNQKLGLGDALGASDTNNFDLKVKANSRVLAIEVPMH